MLAILSRRAIEMPRFMTGQQQTKSSKRYDEQADKCVGRLWRLTSGNSRAMRVTSCAEHWGVVSRWLSRRAFAKSWKGSHVEQPSTFVKIRKFERSGRGCDRKRSTGPAPPQIDDWKFTNSFWICQRKMRVSKRSLLEVSQYRSWIQVKIYRQACAT